MNEIYMIKIWTEPPNARLIKIKYIVSEKWKEVDAYAQGLIDNISKRRKIYKLCKEVKKMIDYGNEKMPEMILTMEDYRYDERSGKNWNSYIEKSYDNFINKQIERNKLYIERMVNQ